MHICLASQLTSYLGQECGNIVAELAADIFMVAGLATQCLKGWIKIPEHWIRLQ